MSSENKLLHPCFLQPADASIKVWRYMDLPKLIWMLVNRKLWLSRVDLLGDPHEGSTPRALAATRDQYWMEQGLEKLTQNFPPINRRLRTSSYVNCWQRLPELAGISLKSIRVDTDKVGRALPVASGAESGKVKLVRGEWISDFLDEASAFPNGSHDDQIDSVSGAFQMISSQPVRFGRLIFG